MKHPTLRHCAGKKAVLAFSTGSGERHRFEGTFLPSRLRYKHGRTLILFNPGPHTMLVARLHATSLRSCCPRDKRSPLETSYPQPHALGGIGAIHANPALDGEEDGRGPEACGAGWEGEFRVWERWSRAARQTPRQAAKSSSRSPIAPTRPTMSPKKGRQMPRKPIRMT